MGMGEDDKWMVVMNLELSMCKIHAHRTIDTHMYKTNYISIYSYIYIFIFIFTNLTYITYIYIYIYLHIY